MIKKTTLVSVFFIGSCLILTSCKMAHGPFFGPAVDSMSGKRAATEARLSTAAAAAMAEGRTNEALAHYAALYKNDKYDRDVAVNYAQLLRKTGQPQQAVDVLKPVIYGKLGNMRGGIGGLALNEYAANLIAVDQLDDAEKILNQVLEDQDSADYFNDAYNLMGIVLDARGQHAEAEQMFRQALEGWKGDATSVMNNLALCLANEGKFDESLTLLRQALVMAPEKEEIARNIDLVSGLRDKVIPSAPLQLDPIDKIKN